MNLLTAVVFVLALVFRQEKLQFYSIQGQAKIWGVVVSAAGALTMVLWQGPTLIKSTFTNFTASKDSIIGVAMIVVGILGGAAWNIVVGPVSRKYPAIISLSATMSFFGTIQTAVVVAFLVKREAWVLKWEGGLVLLAILWGGVLVTGLTYYAQAWCVHKKGPVFTAAFYPLLIVFSFLLEATVLRESTHLGSIIGAVLVILGLYVLLWGKAKEKDEIVEIDESIASPLIY